MQYLITAAGALVVSWILLITIRPFLDATSCNLCGYPTRRPACPHCGMLRDSNAAQPGANISANVQANAMIFILPLILVFIFLGGLIISFVWGNGLSISGLAQIVY